MPVLRQSPRALTAETGRSRPCWFPPRT